MRGRGSSDRGIITTRMSFRAVHIFLIKSILAPSSLMGERFVQFSSEKSKKLSSRSLLYTPSAFYDFLINFFLSCFPFRAFYALRVFSEKFAWTESATFLFGSCLNVAEVLLVHPGVTAGPLIGFRVYRWKGHRWLSTCKCVYLWFAMLSYFFLHCKMPPIALKHAWTALLMNLFSVCVIKTFPRMKMKCMSTQ